MRRRDLLVGAAGLLLIRDALAQERLPPGVRRTRPGDKLTAGADAELVFVVERDAVLLRRSSSLELVKNGFRLVSGAALAVFAPGQRKTVQTPTATVGIRGGMGTIEHTANGGTVYLHHYGTATISNSCGSVGRKSIASAPHLWFTRQPQAAQRYSRAQHF